MTAPNEAVDLFAFDNSYAHLSEQFYWKISPTPVAAPHLIRLNEKLAIELGLEPAQLASPEGLAILAGNAVPENGASLAMAYAGHQFGHFSPELGDGRAILLGEIVDRDGARRDVQLKGAGPTPFSRRGDGRAALGPVLREYIVSEAMATLGIPTTRALAAVLSGERVIRESMLPGAVLTRIASSHIRVGTFQYFAARRDKDAIKELADYAIARHYPDAADAANPYRAFLDLVITRQADLVARWLLVGFIHGVMNTDNMTISGETIDYGPCAFMDFYHPDMVYSSIDSEGRYAYGNQMRMAHWNLARLAEALVPLLGVDNDEALKQAQSAIDAFVPQHEAAYAAGLNAKLGLRTAQPGDLALGQDLLKLMADEGLDFTGTFRALSDAIINADGELALHNAFSDPSGIKAWLARWRQRLNQEAGDLDDVQVLLAKTNPIFIPRNHLVEEAISAAVNDEDYSPFETLLAVLSKPFEGQPLHSRYAQPPTPDQIVHKTFCGT
jgi:uncharacterized protein YdiU (UPF0061 family)